MPISDVVPSPFGTISRVAQQAMVDSAGSELAQDIPAEYYPCCWTILSSLMLNGAIASAGKTSRASLMPTFPTSIAPVISAAPAAPLPSSQPAMPYPIGVTKWCCTRDLKNCNTKLEGWCSESEENCVNSCYKWWFNIASVPPGCFGKEDTDVCSSNNECCPGLTCINSKCNGDWPLIQQPVSPSFILPTTTSAKPTTLSPVSSEPTAALVTVKPTTLVQATSEPTAPPVTVMPSTLAPATLQPTHSPTTFKPTTSKPTALSPVTTPHPTVLATTAAPVGTVVGYTGVGCCT